MDDSVMMANLYFYNPFLEVVTLGCYLAYIYFSFCDGFGLRPARKIVWGIYFLSFSYLSFWATGSFDLRLIIALSSLMAFMLALFQLKENKLKGAKT